MNTENKNLLLQLDSKNYKTFITKMLGMLFFLTINNNEFYTTTEFNEIYKYLVKKNKEKIIENNNIIKDKNYFFYVYIEDNETIFAFSYDEKSRKDLIYYDQNGNSYSVEEKCDYIKDDLVFLLILISKEDYRIDNFYRKNKLEFNKEIYNNIRFPYSFILGSGVDLDYGSGDWNSLIDKMNNEIHSEMEILPIHEKEYTKFIDSFGIKNYSVPQVLKLINRKAYYDTIYDNIYDTFDYTKLNNEDYTLFQIARIINYQNLYFSNEKQNVLTFNYDNLLELLLNKKNSISKSKIKSIYNNRFKINNNINIIHVHGYLPYQNNDEKFNKTIVLSNFEYMDSYRDKDKFSSKSLYNQLDRINIILGNSVSDYQEQFIMRAHIKDHPASYSYLFMAKGNLGLEWMNEYKKLYFLSLGLIVKYFEDIPSIVKEITKYADNLSDIVKVTVD